MSFHVIDYILFAVTLLVTLGIGVYFALKGKHRTPGEFLVADRSLSVLPAAVSITVSFLSGITVLGNATEVYYFGITYWFYVLGISLGVFLSLKLFVPVFFPLKLTSVNQYLELRYESRFLTLVGWLFQVLLLGTTNGVVLYAPALMLEGATGFPVWASIVLTGIGATIYTTTGGFKAVIWTDVFQTVVIFAGVVTVCVQGILKAGGVGAVIQTFSEAGRFNVEWSASPFVRQSAFSLTFPMALSWMAMYGVSQASVQRYCSLKNIQAAKGSVLLVIPGVLIIGTFCCISGIVAYSYYHIEGCDPLRGGLIHSPNQILPFFVMTVTNFPGIPGLFISCLFAGALSNLSSALSGLAALTWKDVCGRRLIHWSDRMKTYITKALTCGFGILCILMGLLANAIGGTLWKIVIVTASCCAVPIICMFILGGFPKTNWRSALVAVVVSVSTYLWLAIGSMTVHAHKEILPTVIDKCPSANFSIVVNETEHQSSVPQPITGLGHLYTISHMWLAFICAVTGMVAARVSMMIPGFQAEDVNPKLLFTFVRYSQYQKKLEREQESGEPPYKDIDATWKHVIADEDDAKREEEATNQMLTPEVTSEQKVKHMVLNRNGLCHKYRHSWLVNKYEHDWINMKESPI